jgi:hypothetical protein
MLLQDIPPVALEVPDFLILLELCRLTIQRSLLDTAGEGVEVALDLALTTAEETDRGGELLYGINFKIHKMYYILYII